jgi:chemotaxis protein MotB
MYKNRKNRKESGNFWISYADLMAGLLFVFILLVGAIVVKYVFIQTDLQAIRADLQKEKDALGLSEKELSDKKRRLEDIKSKLQDTQQENLHLAFKLNNAKKQLELQGKQIEKITLDKELLEEHIATKIEEIALNKKEVQKLKDLLFEYDLREAELKKEIQEMTRKIEENSHTLTLKDEELAQLESRLIVKIKEHQLLVEELDITKYKIKSLTGIRIKVVSKLKDKLGESIVIDKDSGAIRFSSNILFEQDSYVLKESAKEELSSVFKKYINTLLLDEEIKQHIDRIIIEGHTNSDGTYIHNLELSQKRALEVMKFLYEKHPKNRELFKRYVSASGRSYANAVLDKDGVEDKDASRRIEIKFRIKNEKAISELEKFLER